MTEFGLKLVFNMLSNVNFNLIIACMLFSKQVNGLSVLGSTRIYIILFENGRFDVRNTLLDLHLFYREVTDRGGYHQVLL